MNEVYRPQSLPKAHIARPPMKTKNMIIWIQPKKRVIIMVMLSQGS